MYSAPKAKHHRKRPKAIQNLKQSTMVKNPRQHSTQINSEPIVTPKATLTANELRNIERINDKTHTQKNANGIQGILQREHPWKFCTQPNSAFKQCTIGKTP